MLFFRRPPAIKKLRARGDAEGLAAALGYRDLETLRGGQLVDLGVPVRVEAVSALGELQGRQALEALLAALGDEAEPVRATSLWCLRDRPEPEARPALLDTIGTDHDARDELGRSVAIQALLSLNGEDLLPHLSERLLAMEAPLDVEHRAAFDLLAGEPAHRNGRADLGGRLAAELGADEASKRRRAEELLMWLSNDAVEPAIDALRTPAARASAMVVLGRVGDRRAVRPLVERLSDDDGSVRAGAAAALGKVQDPAAIEPLIHATRDPDRQVRAAAIEALDGFGTVAVMFGVTLMLQPLLSESSEGQRRAIENPQEPIEQVRGEVVPPEVFERPFSRGLWSRLWGGSSS